ncbi:glycosyltransferase like family 2-domain-containing protein [Aspergillus avenaceus]|uniref:Glycosyltransferase like family 2-domain-containing protein n=1 Tax=Aspergillus avenaceus TaxID=36643 RepID=A0A5N6TZP8_ASPAV|nr:glycosyltransferase like family 2-domain-containing protein [Aspergillus avenaceus]
MPSTRAGPFVEDIVVPESLLTLISSQEVWDQGAEESPFHHYARPPSGEIRVPKRRQTSIHWRTDALDGREQRQRQSSYSSALEEGQRNVQPSVEEDQELHCPQTGRNINTSVQLNAKGSVPPSQPSEHGYLPDRNAREPLKEYTSQYAHQHSNTATKSRHSSLRSFYNRACLVNIKHQRKFWLRVLIEYGTYTVAAAFVYLVLVGVPIWKGAVYWLYWAMQHKFVFSGGWAIVIILLIFYSFSPLFTTFENEFPTPEYYQQRRIRPTAIDTALLIPCYRSGPIIGRTLEAALKIFPASQIYVIANGNSPAPLDNTEEVCREYGVNHIWCPVGSKIVAIFIGCHAVKLFRYVLLIDDDCILPSNFPVVISRLTDKVRCIGYTIKSVNHNATESTFCQQAQDLEYKIAGLQRSFAGKIGSATFPHGAISLWERAFLKETLQHHPGFSISEDWFMGNSCRRLGGRIQMCSAVFVETTTPSAFFFIDSERGRGGFGETTVFKQRFLRWNFFVANGMWYNLVYIFGSWRLGKWEFGTKIFVAQEIYETLLYIFTPFVLPISLIVRPGFCVAILMATMGLYLLNAIIFNELHLRMKDERIEWKIIIWYYMPYKILISLTNVASCYWSLFKYARYFAKRHPKLTEDHKAVGMVLRLEEMAQGAQDGLGRTMTVRTVSVQRTGNTAELPGYTAPTDS